jgi:hypothetical protein
LMTSKVNATPTVKITRIQTKSTPQACSRTMPSRMLATVSQLSVALSRFS